MKVDKGGGDPVVIAAEQQRPQGIALGGGFVYWTNTFGGTVLRAPK